MQSNEKSAVKGSVAGNAVSRLLMYALNLLVPVLIGPYVARVLDVSLYGSYNAALSVTQWFLAFASFGVYAYGLRQVSRVREDKEKALSAFEPLYRLGVLAAVIAWLFYMAFMLLFEKEAQAVYFILGLQVLFNCLSVDWANEAFERFGFILLKTAVARALYVAAVFLFVKRAEDATAFALITSGFTALNHLLGFAYVRFRLGRVKTPLSALKPLIKPLFTVMLLTNASMLYLMLDRLYLSLFAPNKAFVTYYALPMLIMSAVMNVISSILFATLPRLNALLLNDKNGYKALLHTSSHIFFLIAMPLCAGVGALGPEVMLLYGGGQYVAAGTTLMLFGGRYILNAIELSLSNQVLFIHGMEKELLRIYLRGGLFNLALKAALFALGSFDPAWCIATTMLADLFVVLFERRLIKKRLQKELSPLDGPTLKYALLSLAFFPIVSLLRAAYPLSGVLDKHFFVFLGLCVLVCAALYTAILALTRDEAFYGVLAKIKARGKNMA